MQANGKTIAVTGGGNGIGRELVLQLLAKGARVAALDISEDGLAETARLAAADAERLSTHNANIADRTAVEALPAAIIEAHGQIDGIINCAGIIQPFVKVNALEYSAIERVMNVNFWGVVHMVKTFLPHLLERPSAHIVNISSMGGFLPVPGQSIYGASKAAVKLMTEALHSELTDTNVRVTVIFPGAIGTDISKNSGLDAPTAAEAKESGAPEFKTTSPQEAARVIIDAMERDAFRATIGKDAALMDRLSRLMPERAAAIIYKQMRSLLAG
ncbi:MAG: SDR family oxidoreductase [Coriobacteriia bacterium]|nr:SDR family oxidoreductase [Coriobacteriia bacterium]MBN2840888.1 SDR family oxidoreductase [Coriobacteriia bacterium]